MTDLEKLLLEALKLAHGRLTMLRAAEPAESAHSGATRYCIELAGAAISTAERHHPVEVEP